MTMTSRCGLVLGPFSRSSQFFSFVMLPFLFSMLGLLVVAWLGLLVIWGFLVMMTMMTMMAMLILFSLFAVL